MALLLAGLLVGAEATRRATDAASPRAVATERLEELRELRSRLDLCLSTRDRVELRFQALTRETAGTREVIDSLEALDPRGVPAPEYTRYLDLVDAYNAAITEWERQAQEFRAAEARCREVIVLHNTRAEALRDYLVESGLRDESWIASLPAEIPVEDGAGPESGTAEGAPVGTPFEGAPDPDAAPEADSGGGEGSGPRVGSEAEAGPE